MKLTIWTAVALCAPLYGQAMVRFELANGAVVLYQPCGGHPVADGILQIPGGLRRRIGDDKGRLALAFDVHVDPIGKSALHLSFTPVPGSPFFGQAPAPRDLRPGDHVMVDVLEQPATGRKVYDSLCAGFQATPMRLPTMPDAPATIPSGATLHLDHAQVKEDGTLLAKNSGTQSGTRLRLALPNGGQYTLSSEPGPDFRLEAILYAASGRTVAVFPDGEIMYGVVSASAIVDQPGAWLLWLRRDARTTPRPKPVAPSGVSPDLYNRMMGMLGMSKAAANRGAGAAVPELKIWPVQ